MKMRDLVYDACARDERHECNTSATRSTRVKTYFHTLILTIWQIKDYKEGRNFILGTTFWKCLVKCTTKTELCNCKSYIKKTLEYSCTNLYTNSYCLNEAFPKGSS